MPPKLLAIVVPWDGLRELAPALTALTELNRSLLTGHRMPALYTSGVRYHTEGYLANGQPREQWLTAPVVLMKGRGDCEDLACWRAAELQLGGLNARAIARPSGVGWHIVVQHPNGRIEDPSRTLGMGTNA